MEQDNARERGTEPDPRHGDSVNRRHGDLPLWHPRRFFGRRLRDLDAEKAGRLYLVDRVDGRTFATSALLLVLTLADGVITIVLLDRGCVEANPVMRLFLEWGVGPFFVAKYLLTAIFLPVALVLHRYRLFGTRVRVGHLVPVVAALYVVLIVYQIGLLRTSRERAAPAVFGPAPGLVTRGG